MENNTYGDRNRPNRGAGRLPFVIFLIATLLATNLATWHISRSLTGSSATAFSGADKLAIEYINKMVTLSKRIQEEYLWDVKEEDLWISATKGLVEGTGDIYSSYMTREEYAAFTTSSTNFVGIGVQITNNDLGNVEVVKVFTDGPAFKAGLQIGDQIIAVDGKSMAGMKTDYAVEFLRGVKGTKAELTLLRAGESSEVKVLVTRDTIVNKFVDTKVLDGGIGYIYLSEFGENSADYFRSSLTELENAGAKSLILDLRQNPGGNVYDALEICDALLPMCEIIYTLDKQGEKETHNSNSKYDGIPLAVLIDQNSASAAEIVSGALQDNKRATVIGTKSFGKGIIQFIKPLEDGSMYKLTYQEYYVPSGKKIHGEGITPDIEVELTEEQKKMSVERIPEKEDAPLQKAIEVLKGRQ